MKKTVIVVLLSLLYPLMLMAANLTMVENGTSRLKLHFELGNYSMNLQNAKSPVTMQNATDNFIMNNYNLPVFNYMIQVPNHCKAVISINGEKAESLDRIDIPVIDKELPANKSYTSVSAPFVMRGTLLSTLMIQPFLYLEEKKELKVLTEGDIQIDFVQDNFVTLQREVRQTRQFKQWLTKSVVNYRDESRIGEANGCLLIFYNANAASLSAIQPLIDWKHQKGWEVHAVNSQTIGNNVNSIKSYIQTAYDTWENPPEYILMVGKAVQNNYLPTYWEMYNYNTVGDYQYCLLDGDDIIPDAYIGRFSFSTSTQLSSMINKTIGYEKMTGVTSYDWYNRNILCPDNTDSGPSCTTTIDYVQDLMQDYNPNYSYSYINTGTLSTQMMNAMNLGAGNFYYRGHNGYSGLTNSNISNLVNTGKYPFLCFITCFSGNYGTYSSNCIGDQFMRVGTSSTPIGAVGFIGAACETHTCLNNIMTGAVAYGFYKEGLTSQGQAQLRAKIGLLACYPQYPDDYIPQNFQSVNLLGDPSVDVFLQAPKQINVTYNATAPLTNGSFPVMVKDLNGNPAPNARVCLLKGSDEIFQVGFTDANGVYVFSWASVTAGTGKITVTSPNYCTYQGILTFASQVSAFTMNTTAGFEQLDSGTMYTFPISMTNLQYSTLTNVTATLTSSSGQVEVLSGALDFGTMIQNQAVNSTQNVQFRISDNCPAGEPLAFKLHVQGVYNAENIGYDMYWQVNENGPDFSISNTHIGTTNVLVPGETSQITITLKNNGSVTAANISGLLTCPNPNITLTAVSQGFGSIAANSTASTIPSFTIMANSSMYVGTQVTLVLELIYNGFSTQTLMKTITLGNVLPSAMTGPDTYGYICVANGDNHPWAKPYSWVEANPSLGGTGTVLALTDDDTNGSGSWATVSIPFSFRYYGVMYNQLTICSNGFIMPGSAGSQEWMNWELPGPMVPKPIIAPFWDDLIIQSSSKVVYQYDAAHHRFIVEWSVLKNRYDISQNETFEVIFYDAVAYPTSTGDNAFLFQYSSFHNVDAGNYGVDYVDHGQYATVGIADHTGLVGLEYTYQALYPPSAVALTNNSTLYFAPMPVYVPAPVPVVISCPITETIAVYPNNQADCGETISIAPVVSNSGFGSLKAGTIVLQSTDPYVVITSANSTLSEILAGQNAAVTSPFIFAVAGNCPNMHQAEFQMQITNPDDVYYVDFSVTLHAPQVHFTSFLVDGAVNPVLNPTSTVPVVLHIENMSNLPIQGGTFTLQPSTVWSATPNQFNCSIPALSSIELNFLMQLSANAILGDEFILSGIFNIPGIYDSLFTAQLMVGNWSDLVDEAFENPVALATWSLSTGVSVSAGTHIHSNGSEVVISPTGSNQTYSIESPLINGLDCQRIRVDFTYCNFNPSVANAVYVSYDQGETWGSLFTFNSVQTAPVTVEFLIEDFPADLQTLKFKWVTTTQGENTAQVVVDDIFVQAVHHALGNCTGTVNLENFPAFMTQVRISAPYLPVLSVTPDQSGHFILPLYAGSYPFIKAELTGFLSQYVENVTIISEQTTNGIIFTMPYLQKPVDLQYTTEQNNLHLSWQLENPPDKNSSRLVPDYYKVFIVSNDSTTDDSSTVNSYQCTLEEGTYQVYVKGVFHDAMGLAEYSGSSNILQFNFTANDDPAAVVNVFSLSPNYPNPFNPTTTIKYSISKQDRVTLSIYNIRGQLVNTLVDEVKTPGTYSITFDGTDTHGNSLSSGVYVYRLVSGKEVLTNKMILMK